MKKLIKSLLNEKKLTRKKIESLKKEYAKKNKLRKIPLNSEILAACNSEEKDKLKHLLRTKPTRTISGVSVIAVMAKPAECPGSCIYCPRGSKAPQSYTGYEPAAMRAIANKYDSYSQVKNRLSQLKSVGHATDKNELIIMGGTFPALPDEYQKEFVQRAFDAFNNKKSKTLKEAHKINETAKNRVVGLTIETRPDFVYPEKFLELGATRVELGVQTTYDSILKKINRGHTVKDIVDATKKLKNSGFKVLYHIMPGLPGSSYKKDLEVFRKLFSDPNFKPDMLKIYPTLVIKNTDLYDLWMQEKFMAIDENYMLKLLFDIYKIIPKWIRIMRVQRDIPSKYIKAGPIKSNLRELVVRELIREGISSKEIRFREAGHVFQRTGKISKDLEILVEKYKASSGDEYFISMEDVKQDILLGFLRLRISRRKEALVRELHVYGEAAKIGEEADIQHRGFGRKLLARAEEVALERGKKEVLVISGIGVREYYKKLGYKLKGYYMWKKLKNA